MSRIINWISAAFRVRASEETVVYFGTYAFRVTK